MGEKIFGTPKEVFEEQLNDIFSRSSEDDNNAVLKALSILLHMPESNRDFNDLYNLLGLEDFVAVLTLFENRTIHFPPKEEVKDLILVALLYYYRELEGKSWQEIRSKIPFEFSSISYSSKIKKMNKFIMEKLNEALGEDYE